MTRQKISMRASLISAFKACPTRCRLAYIEALVPDTDTEAQRIGTNWHKLLEIANAPVGTSCPVDHPSHAECPVCGGSCIVTDIEPLERATAWLNHCYATVPPSIEPDAWATERAILAYSLAGWLWYYQNDRVDTLATEVHFELPLRNPETGRALPNVQREGTIDRIVRWDGRLMIGEYKSTSRPIDQDSTYWLRLNLDSQISQYDLAAKELQAQGHLPGAEGGPPIAGTLYDVWHKPGIRPKKLTQAESKKFVEDGLYCGEAFNVALYSDTGPVEVNGVRAEIEPGKNKGTFAIRETPEMFGARLLQDIVAEPTKYFARREIVRTDAELRRFEYELLHIYQAVRGMTRTGQWFHNENQCEATFRCSYCPICYHGVECCDGKTVPPGFKRIAEEAALQEEG